MEREFEIKLINKQEDIPEIGSIVQSDTLWVYQVDDTTCELYMSGKNGKFLKNAEIAGIFQSVEAANEAIPTNRRYKGKTVYIESNGVFQEYWWKVGVDDEHLVVKASSLNATLANGNQLPRGAEIEFISGETPDLPPGQETGDVVLGLGTGVDGTSIVFNNNSPSEWGNAKSSANIVFGYNAFNSYDGSLPAISNISIGASSLKSLKETSNSVVIGQTALTNFKGDSDTVDYPTAVDAYGAGYEDWGKFAGNVAIGPFAGAGLVDGYGNIYIGNAVGQRPANENGKIVIHTAKNLGGAGSQAVSNEYYPLIFGEVTPNLYRKFQIAGKFMVTEHHNPTTTDIFDSDELCIFRKVPTEDGHTSLQITPINKVDIIKSALTDGQFSLTLDQQEELSKKMGNFPVSPGFLNKSNGNRQDYTSIWCTDFIEVSEGDVVRRIGDTLNTDASAASPICWYDEEKNWISSYLGAMDTIHDEVVPAGAHYVRLCSHTRRSLKVFIQKAN